MNHQHPQEISGKQLLEALASKSNLPGLTNANLDSCGLTAFPSEVLKLEHLSVLSLFDNQLAEIPSEISQLRHLRTLNMAQNMLSELPESTGTLGQLEMLDLGHNRLSVLPHR
jgi:Leucine-rich repeat (LRR) protein